MRRVLLLAMTLPVLASCGIGRCYKPYDVKSGDTVSSIASRFDISAEELRRLNRMERDYELHSGDRLFIPCEYVEGKSAKAQVKTAPTPHTQTAPTAAPSQDRERKEEERGAPAPSPSVRFTWPTDGEVVRGFKDGKDASGNGLDLKASAGGTVRAAAAGKVEYAGTPANAYGPMVLISHEDGFYTVYSRLGSIAVKKGESVQKSKAIASAGTEGYIHFEVRAGRKAVDPVLYLPKR